MGRDTCRWCRHRVVVSTGVCLFAHIQCTHLTVTINRLTKLVTYYSSFRFQWFLLKNHIWRPGIARIHLDYISITFKTLYSLTAFSWTPARWSCSGVSSSASLPQSTPSLHRWPCDADLSMRPAALLFCDNFVASDDQFHRLCFTRWSLPLAVQTGLW